MKCSCIKCKIRQLIIDELDRGVAVNDLAPAVLAITAEMAGRMIAVAGDPSRIRGLFDEGVTLAARAAAADQAGGEAEQAPPMGLRH